MIQIRTESTTDADAGGSYNYIRYEATSYIDLMYSFATVFQHHKKIPVAHKKKKVWA